jgi:hypothetical protein
MSTDHTSELRDPTFQAFALLRTVFTVAPILFGLDKFFDILTDWNQYLAPWINDIVPGSATTAMEIVGVIEVAAGILVAIAPASARTSWRSGCWASSSTCCPFPGFYDVALRDFGLLVAALALGRLAQARAVPTRESRSTVGVR